MRGSRRPRYRLVRLTVGIAPPAGTAAIATIAALVGRQLRVAVWADESQIVAAIVGRVSVDMVQDENEQGALPAARAATDRATVRLSLGKKGANVVPATTVDPGLTGFKPPLSACVSPWPAPGRRYRSKPSGCAWLAAHHSRGTLSRSETNGGYRQSEYRVEPPVRIELTTFRLQGGCSTTELRRRWIVEQLSGPYR